MSYSYQSDVSSDNIYEFALKKSNSYSGRDGLMEGSPMNKEYYPFLLNTRHGLFLLLQTLPGREEYCMFIKQNSLKLCHQKYMALCSSCIYYQHKESFEILKNTKLTHPSNKVMKAFNGLKIEDHYDIYKLFYSFLIVKERKKVDLYYFTKFCESLSSYKTCNLVMVFNNLMNFISEFL